MVGQGRLELPTSRLSVVRSNQLSYKPSFFVRLASDWLVNQKVWKRMVEVNGFEPLTFCLQSRRSTN